MTHHKAAGRVALLLGCVIVSTSTAQTQSSDDPLAPFGWFKDLTGYCWAGIHPDDKTNDRQCYSVQFGRLLRGTIKRSGMHGDQPVVEFEGDSVYAWNPKTQHVQYTLWANDGTYGTGEMLVEGDFLIFPPANQDSPGATRLLWNRIDAESFVVTRQERRDGAWRKVFEVTYRRDGTNPAP